MNTGGLGRKIYPGNKVALPADRWGAVKLDNR